MVQNLIIFTSYPTALIPFYRKKTISGSLGFRILAVSFQTLVLSAMVLLSGCGAGGSSGTGGASGGGGVPPSNPIPDFSLSLSQSSLTVSSGSSASISVSVAGSNGFTSPVGVQITGLPLGVTVSPQSAQITPGTSQQFTFSLATYLGASTTALTLTGSSGPKDHAAQLSLAVKPWSPGSPFPRTRYVRSDAVNPYAVIYDSNTNRFFMSDPGSNQIMVFDATTQTEVGTIAVPGAYGMDETPDHTTIYTGTQIGDVYAVDPVGMKVIHRYIASQIGSIGYQAYSVRVMATGKLALLGGQGGIPDVDGYSSFAIWSPTDNSIAIYGGGNPNPTTDCTSTERIFGFTLTGDKALIVLSAGNSICTLDPATGKTTFAPVVGFPVTPTPDGKSLLVLQYGISAQILVLDARTLSQTASFPVVGTSGSWMVVSPDSKTILIAPEMGAIAYAYNIASGTQVGWLPDIFLSPESSPWIQAIDNTGLVAGPMVEGAGFLDTAALQTGPVGSQFLGAYLNPATGSAAGGTQTQIPGSGTLGAIYFGKNRASSISEVSNSSALFNATTPPGNPGPVDVYGLMTDGGMLIIPEGFSYGPTILEATPDSSTAEAGGTGVLYGYGFGVNNGSTVPPDLQISIGGKPVTITKYFPSAYTVNPPFLLEAVAYTIPADAAGSSADITVTTQSGTVTLPAGMHYLPAVQQFPLNGAALAQGIYDAKRDLYYFTDAAEIQVFSKNEGQWLTPIQVPAAPKGVTHRLWGIALSPDGSKLAVSDANAGMIYLINPDSTGSAQSFQMPAPFVSGVVTNPCGLAISDAGVVYFAAFTQGGTGFHGFYKLDTSSAKFTDFGIIAPGFGSGDNLLRVVISSDNTRVFFNNDGAVFSIDTATDKISWALDDPGCCYGDYDLTLSSNQNRFEATSYLYDTELNGESFLTLNDRESFNVSYVYGTKLSPDGGLLFQPLANGIDVYDGRVGTLRTRISLPVALSQNYDALVSDGKDNVLIAITGENGNGIAIVDLSSLSEPSPLPYQDDAVYRTPPTASSEHHTLATANLYGAITKGASVPHKTPRSTIKHVTNTTLLQKR